MLLIHFSLLRSDSKVIEMAVSTKHALVVASQVTKNINLDSNKMRQYYDTYFEHSGNVLDTVMFSEIIRNASAPDTSAWQDDELKGVLMVQRPSEKIPKDYVIEKLNLAGKKQLRYYTRYVNRYNETNADDRSIYYFSRPVYSNSAKFAIIQWDNTQGLFAGAGGIDLYRLEGHEWKNTGTVTSWNY